MDYSKLLISGNSSGLGLGFTRQFLKAGSTVFGFSRHGCPLSHENLYDVRCDLSELESIAPRLDELVGPHSAFDLVILNAGILGEIRDLYTTAMSDIENVMCINVWANKVLLDWLISRQISCPQIVLISSGAAVNGNKGWGAYSLSKATLNMLAMLYAHEMPESHLCALAPGLIDTAMQDYLCDQNLADAERYPSLNKLRSAQGTDSMPTPDVAAQNIIPILAKLRDQPSGCFRDIRTFDQD